MQHTAPNPPASDSASDIAPSSFANPTGRIAIVAGNGPSLAQIDYTRLPPPPQIAESNALDSATFDVFRCNQFYFEEEYFLGKDITYAFATPPVIFEQVYTLRSIYDNGEYRIKNIVAKTFNLRSLDEPYCENMGAFAHIPNGADTLKNLREFFIFAMHSWIYHDELITSGIYACAFAVALGYKEIYIAGIDLYSANRGYAFNPLQSNLLKIMPNYDPNPKPDFMHFPETDLKALEILAKHHGARFYSLCPSSPISKHIPLAPVRADSSPQDWEQVKKSKPKDATRDMLIPSKYAYEKMYYGVSISPLNPLRQNLIYRLVRDILRFPSQTKRYIQAKKRYK